MNENDPVLAKLDDIASYSFYLAMILSVLLGLFSGYAHINDEDTEMTNNSKTNTPPNITIAQDSFNHAADLQKSFNTAAQLQQGNNTNQPASTTVTQPQSTNLGTTGK